MLTPIMLFERLTTNGHDGSEEDITKPPGPQQIPRQYTKPPLLVMSAHSAA